MAQKDIRFARTIQRLQRVIISELEKIGIIHLYTLGFRGDDLLSFTLALNNPSKIAELQEIEHWKAKFDIAGSATEGYFSRAWVADNIFGMSHEEFVRNQREMYYDRKHDAALQQVAEAAAAGETGGALGGGDMGADMGADMDMDMGGEPEMPAAEEMPAGEAGGDESPLLAVPPGSRDAPRLTPGAKGKVYHPVKADKRKSSGPRIRNYNSQYNHEKRGASTRAVFPGSEINTIPSIAKGIYEAVEPTYKLDELNEENKLFEVNESIRSLLGALEEKCKTPTEQENEDQT